MITRKEYLDGNDLHREYYAQFVTTAIRHAVKSTFGLEALLNSTDPYFNDIFLAKWDRLGLSIGMLLPRKLMEEAGEVSQGYKPSMATHVCILKEAARQIVEQHTKETT